MDAATLAEGLHPYERKIVPILKPEDSLFALVSRSGMKEVEVMRALQWLSNKGVVELVHATTETVELDTNGKTYAKSGLPERRFLESLKKEMSLDEIQKNAKLSPPELSVCIGLLKSKAAIDISAEKKVKITDQGKRLLEKGFLEESFLASLPKNAAELNDEERYSLDSLKKRKEIIKVTLAKDRKVTLTELGKELSKMDFSAEVIERMTPELIASGEWKNKKFRRYDVEINVPQRSFGRRHFVSEAVDYVRKIWIDMGFKEMRGTLVQTSFWNFDSLFTAQDHPVRELQDTFYIATPEKGILPDKKILEKVKRAHESGIGESTGWQYKWDPEEAMKNVLRTHTTCLSAQAIATIKKEELPAKFFSVGKCFRNETLDYSHLFEFNQVEGIVVDPNANFRNLLGYLTDFFKKMGYAKVRVRPAYFPYTEPSAEVDVFDPVHNKWLELGGAGIFRPEVVEALIGEDIPVLAWGLGFPRTIREYYNLTDIRDLYKNDLKQMREMKLWLKCRQ